MLADNSARLGVLALLQLTLCFYRHKLQVQQSQTIKTLDMHLLHTAFHIVECFIYYALYIRQLTRLFVVLDLFQQRNHSIDYIYNTECMLLGYTLLLI